MIDILQEVTFSWNCQFKNWIWLKKYLIKLSTLYKQNTCWPYIVLSKFLSVHYIPRLVSNAYISYLLLSSNEYFGFSYHNNKKYHTQWLLGLKTQLEANAQKSLRGYEQRCIFAHYFLGYLLLDMTHCTLICFKYLFVF